MQLAKSTGRVILRKTILSSQHRNSKATEEGAEVMDLQPQVMCTPSLDSDLNKLYGILFFNKDYQGSLDTRYLTEERRMFPCL